MGEKKEPFKDFNLLNVNKGGNAFNDIKFNLDDETNVESVDDTKNDITDDTDDKAKLEAEKLEAEKLEADNLAKAKLEEDRLAAEKLLEDNKEEKTDEVEENTLSIFGKYLAEEGLINLSEEDKIESEDDLKGAIQKTIKSGIEEYKASKPEDIQKFLDFVDAGGDPRAFHKLYYEQMSWSNIDPTNENAQELIVREALTQSGWDPEDIESEITDKKDLGKLAPLAEKFHKKLIAAEEENKQTLVEAQKEHKKRQDELNQKQWEDFKTDFYAQEDLNGFKLTPKQKDELWGYMAKADRKTGKTGLQNHNETNKKAQYLYAWLAFNNWDITKLEKQVKNKVVSQLADKLKNTTKRGRDQIAGGKANNLGNEKKTNNFSSFRTALEGGAI